MEKHKTTIKSSKPETNTDTSSPPHYKEATPTAPTLHQCVRHSRWSSKVFIRADGIDRYCFAPAKDARVWIHADASTDNKALGFLDFPKSHNAFRLNFSTDSSDTYDFTDVRSYTGYPHSGSFTFKSSISGRPREYKWSIRSPGRETVPVIYGLTVGGLPLQSAATLNVNNKGKSTTTMSGISYQRRS